MAKLLAFEAHDINIIDTDDDKLQYIANHLDVHTTKGNSTSFRTLEDAQVAKADLLIAVTESEATNISTSIIGKNLGQRAKRSLESPTPNIYTKRKFWI